MRLRKRGDRKQQEAQHQHEANVGVAQRDRGHDVVGGIEVKQRHRHSDAGDDDACPAGQPVGGAFFLLDVFLRLAQLFVGNDLRVGARLELLPPSSPRLLAAFSRL